ncbi:MAG: amino acid adenylation domain-containing protein [Rhodobacteraceae bacterium]|nr:MAG: amino acid adenylation domain-containing protein [Paracoccaceae bacterium]
MKQETEIAAQTSKDALKAQLKQILRDRIGVTGGWAPLSYGQEALWFLWTLAPDSPAFSMALPLTIRGPLDLERLLAALAVLGARHACLRAEFRAEGGTVMQRAKPDHVVSAEVIDASGFGAAQVQAAVTAHARAPFDLKADVTLRARLLAVAPGHHVLSLVLHHITGDLWSLVVLMDELRALYADPEAALPPLDLTYEHYLRDERSKGAAGGFAPALAYWQERLSGELPLLDLPRDHPRPPAQTFRGATEFQSIDAALVTEVAELARGAEATLFMALLTAYQVLLHRYTGQNRIVTGTPFSGRGQAGLTHVIGDFVNMLPLVADLDPAHSFRDHLTATRAAVIGAIQHQECPFSLIVDAVQPARDISRPPIFQTTFVLQKFQRYPELQAALLPGQDEPPVPFADLTLEPMQLAQQDGQFDLNVEAKRDTHGALQLAWKYAADLFELATIRGMAEAYETLLRQMVATPDRPIGDLALLNNAAAARVIAEGKGPEVPPPGETSVYALFAARAAETPEAPALSEGDMTLSYAQVLARVDPLARALAARGVGPEVMVAVAMPRGCDLAVALLAVMRAGGAFLPLAPEAPALRMRQVLDDSQARIVLTSAALADGMAERLAEWPGDAPQVAAFEALSRDDSHHPLLDTVAGTDLAYMMYTSGSTGKPKGVMVEHLGMVNHTLGKLEDLGFTAADMLAQNAPQSFDVVVWQNLAPLACGGAVRIIPDALAEDPAKLIAACVAHGVTVLQVVPSMMRALLEEAEADPANPPDLGRLRWLVPTGEALPTDLCRRWLALYPRIPILNTYGSTECSDDQCHYRLDALRRADGALPIITVGRPIRNMAAYVLDRNLAPVPAGVVGELYIGGIGVGRGYRGLPERTAKAFLPDPFDPRPGARLYRTGDLARRRADGLIDFLGRIDNMVKLHGVRIDPAEVETALNTHPAIRGAVVRPYAHPAGEQRLVGHIVAPPGTDPGGIRAHLAERLPHVMIPDHFVRLDALPLTPNGKLDLAALPAPDWPEPAQADAVPPRTGTEAAIAKVWKALLKREALGVTEDFFHSGGDSIRSIQVAARCQEMGLPVEALDIFVARTVAALAQKVDLRLATRDDKAVLKATAKSVAKDMAMVSPELMALAAGLVRFDEE